jgi:hypothetical protein
MQTDRAADDNSFTAVELEYLSKVMLLGSCCGLSDA